MSDLPPLYAKRAEDALLKISEVRDLGNDRWIVYEAYGKRPKVFHWHLVGLDRRYGYTGKAQGWRRDKTPYKAVLYNGDGLFVEGWFLTEDDARDFLIRNAHGV